MGVVSVKLVMEDKKMHIKEENKLNFGDPHN
jgi:hypothetical protein